MELGSAPNPVEATISLIPVDFLAQSIVRICQEVVTKGNTIVMECKQMTKQSMPMYLDEYYFRPLL